MNPATIAFIYFDLDDTLLDHRQAERRGLSEIYGAYPAHFAHVTPEEVHATYHAHSVPLWRQYAHGTITKHQIQRLRFEQTLQTLGIAGLDPEAVNTYYLQCYVRHWTFPEPARRAFDALADQFRVGILTNGFSEVQHAKFDRFPVLRERAEVLIISEEAGVMKPHPAIFAYAAEAAGAPAEALLYVGDSYTSDVEGAQGAGWQSAWYTTQPPSAADTVFHFQDWEVLTQRLLDR